MWAPISTSATRNLPMSQAGAGRGRLQHHPSDRRRAGQRGHRRAHAGPAHRRAPRRRGGRRVRRAALPPALHAGFSAAMAQALLLPAAVLVVGPRRGVVLRHAAAPGGAHAATWRPPAADHAVGLGRAVRRPAARHGAGTRQDQPPPGGRRAARRRLPRPRHRVPRGQPVRRGLGRR